MPRRRNSRDVTAAAPRDGTGGLRLHKFLAEHGVGSRRYCEKLIEEGRIAVNGRIVDTLPAWVSPASDRVEVDGRPVQKRPGRSKTYLLVHKPRRVICTNRDPQGRRRIIDLVPHEQRLFCVGRLDADSQGLVLLTDDGALAHRLMHPRYEVPKTYRVSVKGSLADEDLEKLRRGIWLADRSGDAARARAAAVRIIRRDRDQTQLAITLREGRNREIRRMLARRGYRVRRLKRIALGPLKLKGVAAGQWRKLTRAEVAALRRASRNPRAPGQGERPKP